MIARSVTSWETKPRFDNANGKRARCDLSPQKALSNPALLRSVVVGSGIRGNARSSLRFSYRVLGETRTAVHVNVYRRILIRRGLRAVSNVALIGVCARARAHVYPCICVRVYDVQPGPNYSVIQARSYAATRCLRNPAIMRLSASARARECA